MHTLKCMEVWGGIRDRVQDTRAGGVSASLYSSSCDGGKGGDIYYFSVCGKDKLTRVAIADVVGHGEAASQVSRLLFEALEAHVNDTDNAGLLAELNRVAFAEGTGAITTAVIAAYHGEAGRLYLSYAGHPPALIKRSDASTWTPAEIPVSHQRGGTANIPLAVVTDPTYDQQDMAFGPGDRMLLYTDGVLEARAPGGELFGRERLRAVLDDYAGATPPGLLSALMGALRAYTGGALSHDDVTIIAAEVV